MNLKKIRFNLAIDKNPAVIEFAQTWHGKVVMLLVFMLPLYFLCQWWPQAMIIIAGITFMSEYRRAWVMLGMISVIVLMLRGENLPGFTNWYELMNLHAAIASQEDLAAVNTSYLLAGVLLCTFLLSFVLAVVVNRFQRVALLQSYMSMLFLIYFILLAVVLNAPLTYIGQLYVWSFIVVFVQFFWFIAYTLKDCRSFTKNDLVLEYGRYIPIWGSFMIPIPKGSAFLRRIEAKSSTEFAVTQLKGIKLIWWAAVINIVFAWLKEHYFFRVPMLWDALKDYEQGAVYPWYVAWGSLFVSAIFITMFVTVVGHTFVATCRMCGYRALRNTYKPFYSTTLIEFWNRYFYYFKELMADFFFYPTYFRCFKAMPRLRLFFATFVAAGLGNFLCHFVAMFMVVKDRGFINAIAGFESYIFYSIILGTALGLSQIRNAATNHQPVSGVRKLFSILFVLAFFLFLSIFTIEGGVTSGIMINFKFLLSLFNITW